MPNILGATRILDNTALTFGDSDNFKMRYNTSASRWEILDVSNNVVDYIATVRDGDYTPTIVGVANVTSTANPNASYMRINNKVIVQGRVDVTATANSTFTRLRISLPIATTFSNLNRCTGSASHVIAATNTTFAQIQGDTTNHNAEMRYASDAAAAGVSRVCVFNFMYRIA
jgi:hypothetical protein